MIQLGIDPVISAIAVKFAISVAGWVVSREINAAAAAEQAAAEFDYFRQISDAELTPIAMEMAKQFPEYPVWRWMEILQNIRKYGASVAPQPEPPPVQKAEAGAGWIWIAVGVALILILWHR